MRHPRSWYKPGRTITVNDKMQSNYTYTLTAKYGKLDFSPDLSPKQILALGAFEGKYLNDCINEFPTSWYLTAKTSVEPDPSINLFKIKSRLSLQEWRRRKWIINPDVRGWFQWYCRYYIGRRIPEVDAIQIKRYNAFQRHVGQIKKSIQRMPPNKRPKTRADILKHRPRQRQALLQWAHDPFVL